MSLVFHPFVLNGLFLYSLMFSGEKGVLGTNGLTKKGFKSKISRKLLANDTTDDDLDNFAKERFKGEISIWKPITQTKLHTIGSNIKDATVKIKDQLVPVKGHKLFSIFLKVRRTRHDRLAIVFGRL